MRRAICKQFVSKLKSSALSVYSNIVPLHVLKMMKTMATRYFAQTAAQNSFKGVISLDFYYHVFFFFFFIYHGKSSRNSMSDFISRICWPVKGGLVGKRSSAFVSLFTSKWQMGGNGRTKLVKGDNLPFEVMHLTIIPLIPMSLSTEWPWPSRVTLEL